MDGARAPGVGRKRPGPLAESLEMIKFSHTIFAMPFALLAAFRAAGGWPAPRVLIWIVVAMVAGRTAAMAFNRIVDRGLDARNPRTASRALPAGRLPVRFAAILCALSAALLVLAAAELNPLAFALSPAAIALLFFYSYTKRFTSLSHLVLGACLGIAPVGAWIAVRGEIGIAPIELATAVLLWTAGFDVLYSLQDVEFDRAAGLFSIPRRLGIPASLAVSALLHAGCLILLVVFERAVSGGIVFTAGVVVAAAALAYQHAVVRPSDLSRLDAAFFRANGLLSAAVGLTGIVDLWVRLR